MGENILLPLPYSYDSVSSSVYCFIHLHPVPQLPLAYGAWRSPLIIPGNRIQLAGGPRHIQCYKIYSNDRGICCWEATTQLSGNDPPFQCCSRRGVVSFFFQVRAPEGQVTFLPTFLQGVCAPNSQEIIAKNWNRSGYNRLVSEGFQI